MRKLLWGCAAAGVLAGGVFLTARHALHHPDSTLGRSVLTAAALNPLCGGGTRAAEELIRAWRGEGRADHQPATDVGEDNPIPSDPVPCPEPTPELPMAGVVELPPMPRDVVPASIVIPEDQVEPTPAPVIEQSEPAEQTHCDKMPYSGSTIDVASLGSPVKGSSCASARKATAPLYMPHCQDSASLPTMPYCEKQTTCPKARKGKVKKVPQKSVNETRGSSEACEPTGSMSPGDYSQDVNHSYHHSGCGYTVCPYTGRCYPTSPYTEPPATTSPRKEEPKGKEETSEPPAPARKKTARRPHLNDANELFYPTNPELDTMEYRPSDGGLNENGPGPF